MKKIVIPGILAGVVILIVEMLISFAVPSLKAQYENPALFRSWADPIMQLYYLYPFVLGILLAWFWGKVKITIPTGSLFSKAFRFGWMYWLVATIPGMLVSYSSFQVSLGMVLSWAIGGLIATVFGAAVIIKLDRN